MRHPLARAPRRARGPDLRRSRRADRPLRQRPGRPRRGRRRGRVRPERPHAAAVRRGAGHVDAPGGVLPAVRGLRARAGAHPHADRTWTGARDDRGPVPAVHVHEAVVAHHAAGRLALDLRDGDVFWCTADPGWVTGTSYGIISPLTHGATMVVDEGEFDAERWYGILRDEGVDVWYTALKARGARSRRGRPRRPWSWPASTDSHLTPPEEPRRLPGAQDSRWRRALPDRAHGLSGADLGPAAV